jgi:undecaprenyl-diphosphatase
MDLVHYLQIAVLALIQGAAELLPVSSSAHVIVAERLMGMDPSRPEQVFLLVMLHTGTMFAVLVYFWTRWRRLWQSSAAGPGAIAAGGAMSRGEIVKLVVVATVATGVVALGLKVLIEQVVLVGLLKYPKGDVEELFKHLPLIAAGLAAVGVLILATGARDRAGIGGPMTGRASLWIGLVQGLCVPFRGFSRSGATISTGLFCGVGRGLCEDFSFALALILTPPVQVYSLSKLLAAHSLSRGLLVETLVPALAGMVLSFLAGLMALRFLSSVLERGRWKYFGIYCLVAAAAIGAVNFILPAV